jgi:hypothetical protein
VELEQSGWGTKVTFHATVPEPDPTVEPKAVAEPVMVEPEPAPEPEPTSPEPMAAQPEPDPTPEPVAAEPTAEPAGWFKRWLFKRRGSIAADPPVEPEVAAVAAAEPEPIAEPEPVAVEPEPVAIEPERAPEPVVAPTGIDADHVQRILDGTLDALGQAHHRPFSRG